MKKAFLKILAIGSVFSSVAQTPCRSITLESDKFTGEITTKGRAGRFEFERISKGKEMTYYVTINSPGAVVVGRGLGLIVLLEGGLKIEKPGAVIELVQARRGIAYNKTRVELTAEEWKLFKTRKVEATRLHKNDADVDEPESIIELLNCF